MLPLSEMHEPRTTVSREPCNVYKQDLYRYIGENMHIPMIINIVGLICSLGCPQRKTTNIYCPIIEGATHSTFQQHPSAPKAAMTTNIRCAAAGSCSSTMLAARCFKEGTGNDIRKYMIRSQLSNVSDSHVKSL